MRATDAPDESRCVLLAPLRPSFGFRARSLDPRANGPRIGAVIFFSLGSLSTPHWSITRDTHIIVILIATVAYSQCLRRRPPALSPKHRKEPPFVVNEPIRPTGNEGSGSSLRPHSGSPGKNARSASPRWRAAMVRSMTLSLIDRSRNQMGLTTTRRKKPPGDNPPWCTIFW